MQKHCKTLILGSAFAGLGYLLAHEDAVLIEETEVIGNDFCGIFRPSGPISNVAGHTDTSVDFLRYCRETGAVKKDEVDILWLSTVTYRYLAQHALGRIFFGVALVSLIPVTKDGHTFYEVTVRSNEGLQVIYAEQVLDVTMLRISDRSGAKETARLLHAVSTDFSFHTLSFPEGTEILSAREQLEAYFEAQASVKPFACIGFYFDYRTIPAVPCRTEGILWINPSDFSTPFDAMDAGVSASFSCERTGKTNCTAGASDLAEQAPCGRAAVYCELRERRVLKQSAVFAPEATYDCIVCGLGAGGSMAAYSVAKEGLSVLGLERGCAVGGMSVQGCVNNYYNGYEGGSFELADQKADEKIGTVYAV